MQLKMQKIAKKGHYLILADLVDKMASEFSLTHAYLASMAYHVAHLDTVVVVRTRTPVYYMPWQNAVSPSSSRTLKPCLTSDDKIANVTDGNGISRSNSDVYGANCMVPRAMTAFTAIAWYKLMELLILIFFIFRRYSGLHFWSLIVNALSIVPYATGKYSVATRDMPH
jgi:hypothetical protein